MFIVSNQTPALFFEEFLKSFQSRFSKWLFTPNIVSRKSLYADTDLWSGGNLQGWKGSKHSRAKNFSASSGHLKLVPKSESVPLTS